MYTFHATGDITQHSEHDRPYQAEISHTRGLLGGIINDMYRTDIAEKDRINVYADAGYVCIIKHLPGINSWQPHEHKKDKLAPEQKRHNRDVNNVRIAVEHGIERMKKCEIVQGPYRARRTS